MRNKENFYKELNALLNEKEVQVNFIYTHDAFVKVINEIENESPSILRPVLKAMYITADVSPALLQDSREGEIITPVGTIYVRKIEGINDLFVSDSRGVYINTIKPEYKEELSSVKTIKDILYIFNKSRYCPTQYITSTNLDEILASTNTPLKELLLDRKLKKIGDTYLVEKEPL